MIANYCVCDFFCANSDIYAFSMFTIDPLLHETDYILITGVI